MSFELILPFLRPIEPLLLDESVSEIMGNPDAAWFYERDGRLCQEPTISFDAGKLRTGLEVIANQLGKKLDEDHPRLPGFLNCKYDPACRVTVEYPGDSTWNSDDFRLDILASDAILSSRAITPRKHSSNHTHSEHDWAWILHELARGKDAAKLTRKLASRRADKPNPLYYAQRTVEVASARLWLIEGIPIDDVVTLLELRRRFEIPVALCRARALEIAQTAQRMIARRKIADSATYEENKHAVA